MKSKLPCAECGGRCCRNPVFTEKEYMRVKAAVGIPPGSRSTKLKSVMTPRSLLVGEAFVVTKIESDVCPWLSKRGCMLGDLKPQVCKLYGEIEDLPCEFLHPKKALEKHLERLKRNRAG